MKLRLSLAFGLFLLFSTSIWCQTTTPSIVRFNTSMGAINVTLYPNAAPKTVANFLSYMNSGAYNDTFFHRSVQTSPLYVIQGGGYRYVNGSVLQIPTGLPIPSEFSISNTLGTIAMALSSDASGATDPDSATCQWFFNTADNSGTLDAQKFTVFGQIGDTTSLAVMAAIAALTPDASAIFPAIPLVNYTSPNEITEANLVLVSSIAPLLPAPSVGTGGAISASGFGGFAAATAGSFVEIYGTNLAGTTRSWTSADFNNGAAPTSLDGVTVTVGGQPAFVEFVSPGQVNVQVPSNVPIGPAPVVVTYGSQTSAAITLAINASEGGLLAPGSFNIGGTQYVAATHATTGAFVTNGNIPGLAAAPAVPGETLVFYGVGFGAVTPSTTPVAGEIVQGATTIATPVQFTFGSTVAQVTYQGFAPGEIGVYQFNVVVPSTLAAGDVALQVSQGGAPIPQNLYISVQ